MSFEAWGIRGNFYLQTSELDTAAWLLVVGYAVAIGAILWATRREWRQASGRRLLCCLGFILIAFPLAQFLLIRLDEVPNGATIALLSGVLALLSGVWLGVGPALLVGFAGGLARAGWGSHIPFEPFEFALVAALAASLLRQRYRGKLMAALRQPLIAGPLSAALIWPLRFPGLILQSSSPPWSSFDYALAQMGPAFSASVIEILIGGVVVQILYALRASLRPNGGADKMDKLNTSLSHLRDSLETARRDHEQLKTIVASIADAVLVADHHNILVMANPAAEALFGIDVEAATGQPVHQVIESRELVELLSKRSADAEVGEVLGQDEHIYAAHASPLMAQDGTATGRVVVLHDITPLKEINATKDDFVQIVAHDLRSPLTYMRGYATMMGMIGELNPKQTSFADKIVIGIEQMSNLIENMLDIGRLESGGELERAPCDLAIMIEEIVAGQRAQALTKQITLTANAGSNLPVIMADEHMLKQAITNLVDNAIKYTPQAGDVLVETQLGTSHFGVPHVIVSVSDNGPGISEADQAHLFEKFYRVRKKENIKVKGSGLGLTIVKGVAQRHGGDAWVESTPGEGTKFYLSIEVVPPSTQQNDT